MEPAISGRHHPDSGQVIVLFALSLVAMLAVIALIFDGGRVYGERRRAQNAADAASNAGAAALDALNPPTSVLSSRPTAGQAACAAAAENGFGSGVYSSSAGATCGPNGTIVQVHIPASTDGTNSDGASPAPLAGVVSAFEKPGYVQVEVTSAFRPFIAGVVGLTNFQASALAVSVNIPGHGVGYTLLVLDPIDCASLAINASNVEVSGGGVLVNSAASKSASTTACTNKNAATLSGNASLTTTGGFTNNVVGSGDVTGVTPSWTSGANQVPDPLAYVHIQDVTAYTNIALDKLQPGSQYAPQMWSNSKTNPFPAAGKALPPGTIWGGITVGNGDNLVLAGGIYVMAGGGFNVSGGTVSALGPVTFVYTIDPYCNSGDYSNCTKNTYKQYGDMPSISGQQTGGGTGSWGIAPDPTTGIGPLQAPGEGCTGNPPTGCKTAPIVGPDADLNGILIYVDRNVAPCSIQPGSPGGNMILSVGGNGSFYFDTGSIIYNPCGQVKLYGNGPNQGGAVVAYLVELDGNTKSLNLGGPGTPSGAPSKTNLVQ